MGSNNKFEVLEQEKGQRLDIFLSKKLDISRSQTKKIIDRGHVLVNAKEPKKAGDKLNEEDNVEVKPLGTSVFQHEKVVNNQKNKELKINVIAEIDDYLIIDKPAGLLIHPTEANELDTLTAWLLEKYPKIKSVGDNPEQRPGIVHRLDKDASGLLVVARTQKMFCHLKKQFQARSIEKEYKVLVYGDIETDHDIIDFEIDRGKDGRMASRPKINKLKLKNIPKIQNGKNAITEFWVEKRFKRFNLLRVKIHTGRTHQIRVHLFSLGHPVVGDNLYFNKKLFKKGDQNLDRLFLHAKKLCFKDLRGKKKCFNSRLPKKLQNYLDKLI